MHIFANEIVRLIGNQNNKPSPLISDEHLKNETLSITSEIEPNKIIYNNAPPSIENISNELESQSRRYNSFLDIENEASS